MRNTELLSGPVDVAIRDSSTLDKHRLMEGPWKVAIRTWAVFHGPGISREVIQQDLTWYISHWDAEVLMSAVHSWGRLFGKSIGAECYDIDFDADLLTHVPEWTHEDHICTYRKKHGVSCPNCRSQQ